MKTILQKIFVLISVLALIVNFTGNVFAAGNVTYNGNSRKFVFEPGSSHSPTDLFCDFKDVMPGDSITQKVHIKNDISNDVKIKLYMRSLGATKDSEDFLSKLNLKVSQDGASTLFDAPASNTAQLTEWTYLGTFYSGAAVDLNITLDVPVLLENMYQEAVGYINWQFKIEELPIEPDDPLPPQTGDTTNLLFYISLASITGLLLIVLLVLNRRKKTKYN